MLRRNADKSKNVDQATLSQTVYDIENVIDELIIKSIQARNRVAFLQSVWPFLDLPLLFFHVVAVVDLIDQYNLCKKLEQLKIQIRKCYSCYFQSGAWVKSFDIYDPDTRTTILSPVVSKFEALATLQWLNPDGKKLARWLRDEFKSLHDFLIDVEAGELSQEGIAWMEELCETCRSADNVVGLFMDTQQRVIRNWKAQLRSLIWAPHNFMSQQKLGNKMSWIKARVLDISARRFEAIPSSTSQSNSSIFPLRSIASTADEETHIAGFEEDVDAVIAQLLKGDSRCVTISIMGVRGIGKTSLARLIYNSQVVVDSFPHRAWISRREDVMKKIMGLQESDLYYDPWNHTVKDHQERLTQMISEFFVNKKYIIVVDDSDPNDFWEMMASAFTCISNGTRMLFTVPHSHRRSALEVAETNLTYKLHLRSDDESWALFTHILKVNISPELQNLKQNILRTCGGLRKVIVKLGEALTLADATVEEWSRVLEQLNQDEEPWSQDLEEINKYLPLHLRRCLFYFGLFPAGYKIPARRLISLWVAEGLGGQKSDEKPPEYVTETILKELINYNMVQVTERKLNGKVRTCCLPEALRVHWFSKAKQANFLQGHSDTSRLGTSEARRLSDQLNPNDAIFDHIHGNTAASSQLSCYRNVVSFLSFDTREGSKPGEEVGNFLDRCISNNCFHFLWVVDLENVYKPKLPKAVGKLTRLRYLGLRSTYLEVLPMFIDKLLNLQTLDLKRTCIDTLPSSIWKMQKLRCLFLDESFCTVFVPRQEESTLGDLQTLWGVFIDEDSPVEGWLNTLSNIRKLGLKSKISFPSRKAAMSSQLAEVGNWIMNLKCLQNLRLKSFDESSQPWDLHLESLSDHKDLSVVYLVGKLMNKQLVSELPLNLTELTLSASGLEEDPMQILDKLPNLRILRLFSRSFTGNKMLCCVGGFPKLEILKFRELKQLEEWNVDKGILPFLIDLEIRLCMKLKMLPDGLRYIKTLREVKLTKLRLSSSRIKDKQGEDWSKIAHVRHVWIED